MAEYTTEGPVHGDERDAEELIDSWPPEEPSAEATKWAAEHDAETASELAALAYDAGRASMSAERDALLARIERAKAVPQERYPDNSNAWDDGHVEGWNDCRARIMHALGGDQ